MSRAVGFCLNQTVNSVIELLSKSLKESLLRFIELLPFVISVNGVVVPHLTFRFRVENGSRTGEIELAAKDKALGWFGLTEDCTLAVNGRPVSLQRLKLMLSSIR